MISFEQIRDALTGGGIPVAQPRLCPMIEVGAAGQAKAGKEIG
jgi:hypothetical protein